MSLTKSLTQGGQVTLHHFRMLQQVAKVTIIVSLGIGFLVFCMLIYKGEPYNRTIAMTYYWAEIKTSLPFLRTHRIHQTLYLSPTERRVVRSVDILNNSFFIRHKALFEKRLLKNALWSGFASIVTFMVCCAFWIVQGRAKKRKKF